MKTLHPAYMDDDCYDAAHDAYYDKKTGEWLEEKCSDEDCEFCANRPPKHAVEDE